MNYKLARISGKSTERRGEAGDWGSHHQPNNDGTGGGGGGKVLSAEMQTTILEAGLEPATQRSPLESNPSCLGDPLGYITTMVW